MSDKWIDQGWKSILIKMPDEAIEFFLPDLAAKRDHSQKILFLRDEHPVINSGTDKDMRVSDACFGIPLLNDKIQRVALYVEQQHWRDENFENFARRMFEGYYRASDRLRVPVTSLAIFTGNIEEVDSYHEVCFGTEVLFKYNTYSVRYADIEELKHDKRAFAICVLAAILMLKADGLAEKREEYARVLAGILRERDYPSETKYIIRDFVGMILRLSKKDITPQFRKEWRTMEWVPIEEVQREIFIQEAREEGLEEGMEKGLEEGEAKKAFEVARRMLSRNMSVSDIIDVTGLGEDDILSLS
ncbi:hypothetical protein AGMMS50276_10660 [Synergistales bacterium]|nr:hypothetical protein AGMMS50276_10660 [Synergistales bacterium]